MVFFLMCTLGVTHLYAGHRNFPAAPDKTNHELTVRESGLSLAPDSLTCYSAKSNDVPWAISNPDAAIVSSILKVELSGLISSVNIFDLSIAHTRVGNLTVTLTSPEGTTVTLLDRPGNGACMGDNLFLYFEDAAIATSDELHNTCNTTVPAISGSFQPLQPMSAFEGENAFGDWILTVTDHVPGAGGALVNWGLEVCSLPCGLVLDSIAVSGTSQCDSEDGSISIFTSPAFNYPVIYTINSQVPQSNETGIFTNLPVGVYQITAQLQGVATCIVDTTIVLTGAGTGYAATDLPADISTEVDTAISVIHISTPNMVTSVKVSKLDIRHTWVGDLRITLTSPSGTVVVLKDRDDNAGLGCNQEDLLVVFDDGAVLTATDLDNTCNTDTTAILGTFQPATPLAAFANESMMGDWILTVYDEERLDYGFISEWQLEICSQYCGVALTDVTVQDQHCNGADDGSIVISAQADVLPVTYAISGPVNQMNETGIFENLPVGEYAVSVTSNDGTCTARDMATIIPLSNNGLPPGWSSHNIGNAGGSSTYDACAAENEFTLTSKGTSGLFDIQHSLLRSLCGDGSIIARVTSIENAGWAGIEIRENTTTSSRKVNLKTQLGAFARRMVRNASGAPLQSQQLATPPGPIWLQIQRAGNSFKFFISEDGTNWQQVGNTVTLALSNCVYMGLFVEGLNANTTTTAVFDNVSVTRNAMSLSLMPGASVSPAASPASTLQLYPNPTTGEVTIDLSDYTSRPVQLLLYDAQGSLLKQLETDDQVAPTQRLDFSNYQNGVYLVRLRSKGLPDAVKQVVVQGQLNPGN